jgi:IS605 OrfB family transposase
MLDSIDLLKSKPIEYAIIDGGAIHTRFGEEKVIFGGKSNLAKRLSCKISKEEYQLNRLCPATMQGTILEKGNCMFNLDIITNNQIIFKINKDTHIEFKLPKLRKNIKKELFKLEELNQVRCGERGYKYTVRFDLDYVYISFDEFKDEPVVLKKNRCLGIDLNPDTIGISVLNDGEVIHTQEFSLKPIFDKIFSEKLSSSSARMKYYHNKLKFETFEISKIISQIAKHFNCMTVYVEDLQFKSATTVKISNRKNKNLWKRDIFVSNLKKRLNIIGIKLYSVNPAYSSFIGNMMYDYTDSVNASIEIARRGFEYRIKENTKGFYPDLLVKHQWKKTATKYTSWKQFFNGTKNSKLKYRVSLDECLHPYSVFQQNSTTKSLVNHYIFSGLTKKLVC